MERIAAPAHRRSEIERRRRQVRRVVATAALEAALTHPATAGHRRRPTVLSGHGRS
ncbi:MULTISPECIES: hypothetical protein [unclassified Aeromicrobium]|uniref:hypothetical protein n=1 Tax=unclassified Aeromicrobium TaxID=2633570 RepID=UPI000B1023F4|nr:MULTISPECIES: hypothetical protein [unclassified Aeromicrobium]